MEKTKLIPGEIVQVSRNNKAVDTVIVKRFFDCGPCYIALVQSMVLRPRMIDTLCFLDEGFLFMNGKLVYVQAPGWRVVALDENKNMCVSIDENVYRLTADDNMFVQ